MLKIYRVGPRLRSIIPPLLIAVACTTSPTPTTASVTGTINVTNAYNDGSYNYIVSQDFGTAPDTGLAPTISQLRIFENGAELGPSHSSHADIRNAGQGRFSHWGGSTGTGGSNLYFSTSDNSDPRTNGRMYTYQIDTQPVPPQTPDPTPISHPTVTATLLGQTGEDIIGTHAESPDGIMDVHIRLTGVSGTIQGVRITALDGIWVAPLSPQGYWTVAIRPQSDPSVVDLFFDLWIPLTSYNLTVTFSDGATQTLQTVSVPTPPPAAPTVQLKTDLGVYYEPPLPAMGLAGSKIVDPTFGTTIVQVTDSTTGADCRTPYSHYPVFNSSSTRLYVQCGKSGIFYSFDPVTMAISYKQVAPSRGVQWYGAVWSGVNPDIIYGNSATELLAYNVATNVYSVVRNFSAETATAGATYLIQMSMSRDDDVFAFSYGRTNSANFGYVVWKRSTNTILLNQLDSGADEVHVDKSGRYLQVAHRIPNDMIPQIWDLQTGTMTQLGSYDGGDGYVHYDTGHGTIFTQDGSGRALAYRSMATPSNITTILPGYFGFANLHYSMNADNERWALVWVQRNDTLSITKPFENELLQVATDGSGRVRRIAHHRSQWDDYYDQPNANISRDGQFVAFTSNWGNATGRRDVYIVQIPPAPTN